MEARSNVENVIVCNANNAISMILTDDIILRGMFDLMSILLANEAAYFGERDTNEFGESYVSLYNTVELQLAVTYNEEYDADENAAANDIE